jgi:ATP-dependent helicase/nuclease subunit A
VATEAATHADVTEVAEWRAWTAAREHAIAVAAVPRVRSATAIAREAAASLPAPVTDPGLAKDPRDLELPPWNKGRYGTAVGRAVHAVLQTVDLATGDGIEPTAAAQAAAEGVIGLEADIAALARAGIASDVVREAVAHGFRREMHVAAPVGDRVLEGYVDLVYRTPGGLVVVDYKTDSWATAADLEAKLARYRLQGASYALALELATGERVDRCVFLFLSPEGAVSRDVVALEEAMAEVRVAMASDRTPVGR